MSLQSDSYHKIPSCDTDFHDVDMGTDENHLSVERSFHRSEHNRSPSRRNRHLSPSSKGLKSMVQSGASLKSPNSHDTTERETISLSPSSSPHKSGPPLLASPPKHISHGRRLISKTSDLDEESSVQNSGGEIQYVLKKDNVIDFDSDDEEDDLGRYNFDFNHALGINSNAKMTISGSYRGSMHTSRKGPQKHDEDSTRRFTRYTRNTISPATRIFGSIKEARMVSRQRRMEKLLALDGANSKISFYKERVCIWISTNCDLLEIKGFVLVLVTIVAYSVIVGSLGEEHRFAKNLLLGLGIPLIIFRLSWRPLSWYVCRRKQEKVSSMTITSHSIHLPRLYVDGNNSYQLVLHVPTDRCPIQRENRASNHRPI